MKRKRTTLTPLADPSRRPWVKRALDKRDLEAQRKAAADPVKGAKVLAKLRDLAAMLDDNH